VTTPLLETERLLLRPFTRADSADVFAYASNPNVSQFMTWQTHRTLADANAFIDMVLARGKDEATWAICLRPDTRAMGAIEFKPAREDEAEFHYVLAEPLWNRGVMTEAARAVIAWGFAQYPTVKRVVTRAVSENVASQRVMEKCGLRFQRVRFDNWKKSTDPVEMREFAITRSDWESR
jgi:ribosomal-protein-alanine N-acetyltransferase